MTKSTTAVEFQKLFSTKKEHVMSQDKKELDFNKIMGTFVAIRQSAPKPKEAK